MVSSGDILWVFKAKHTALSFVRVGVRNSSRLLNAFKKISCGVGKNVKKKVVTEIRQFQEQFFYLVRNSSTNRRYS